MSIFTSQLGFFRGSDIYMLHPALFGLGPFALIAFAMLFFFAAFAAVFTVVWGVLRVADVVVAACFAVDVAHARQTVEVFSSGSGAGQRAAELEKEVEVLRRLLAERDAQAAAAAREAAEAKGKLAAVEARVVELESAVGKLEGEAKDQKMAVGLLKAENQWLSSMVESGESDAETEVGEEEVEEKVVEEVEVVETVSVVVDAGKCEAVDGVDARITAALLKAEQRWLYAHAGDADGRGDLEVPRVFVIPPGPDSAAVDADLLWDGVAMSNGRYYSPAVVDESRLCAEDWRWMYPREADSDE
ncbi:hypothetical protein SISNIDRAFT_455656 [Sistotremastrum niveocremeum HHB9708]|uniref:Uncharacterized protein n=1 Tax=Sistotremastrum niveocremeum HHB9708 TaxID=1314777 RepID=A0A164TL46_9AGAM|nr:hypothetical protein SISNIDRAFT_455656 [Sistotremastrum niveocremeum HHB9708]